MKWTSLQYITSNKRGSALKEEVEEVLEAGARWVQLRLKYIEFNDYAVHAHMIRELCEKYAATCIVNDSPEVTKEARAHGVHLGANDLPIELARDLLGDKAVIGATAHSVDDIVKAHDAGASYIGLGPYRYTETKENIRSPIGDDGLVDILASLGEMSLEPNITLIGGIKVGDIETLKTLGITSVAVSSAIASASDRTKAVTEFLKSLGGE